MEKKGFLLRNVLGVEKTRDPSSLLLCCSKKKPWRSLVPTSRFYGHPEKGLDSPKGTP